MDLAKILCSSSDDEEKTQSTFVVVQPTSAQVLQGEQISTETKRGKFVPDKERKRPYRMSVTQRQRRHEHEAYESRVYNLTLDINESRQQLRCLVERRDLYIARLLLHRQHVESRMLEMAWDLLSSYNNDTYGLTPSGHGTYFSNGNIQFVMERGQPGFTRRSFVIKHVRVLSLVDGDNVSDEYGRDIRQVCGAQGGCMVEVLVTFTGRIIRKTLVTMFPLTLRDEGLASQLVGLKVTFVSRLLVFFDEEGKLVRQVMQADIVHALSALKIGGMSDFAVLAGLTSS